MGQHLPNLAPLATASSSSFQNKPQSHKVAFISFPGRRGRRERTPDGPKETKLWSVCMRAPKTPHEGQRFSQSLSAGLLAKVSERQLHNLSLCEMGYMASGEKDVLSKKSSLLSFYARWPCKAELPRKLGRLDLTPTAFIQVTEHSNSQALASTKWKSNGKKGITTCLKTNARQHLNG